MPKPPLSTAPAAATFDGVACPLARAAAITRLVHTHGTLTAGLARLRKAAIREARKSHTVIEIAEETGLSYGRVSQLSKVN